MSAMRKMAERMQRPDGIRRLGQALWMMAETPLDPARLIWARGALGPDGELLLAEALREAGAISPEGTLLPSRLAWFLAKLWSADDQIGSASTLVWTLPKGMSVDSVAPDSYLKAASHIISSAQRSLILISPYLEARGVGKLQGALLDALYRGVDTRILAHDLDLASQASEALQGLRSETIGLRGSLAVFASAPDVLVHLKVVVADESRVLLGSANLTHSGLGRNLELGVRLDSQAAREIGDVIEAAIASDVVRLVFTNKIPTADLVVRR